jgi:hypothetical protein
MTARDRYSTPVACRAACGIQRNSAGDMSQVSRRQEAAEHDEDEVQRRRPRWCRPRGLFQSHNRLIKPDSITRRSEGRRVARGPVRVLGVFLDSKTTGLPLVARLPPELAPLARLVPKKV